LKFDLGRIVTTVFEPITSQHFETTLSQNNLVSNAIKRDLGRIVTTVFEPITSQHFETTLSQNNVVSNAIKRDHWIAII